MLNVIAFQICLKVAIRRVKDNEKVSEYNRTRQVVVFTGSVNFLGENGNIVKENTEFLLNAAKDVGLEVNTEKTKCIFMPRHQTTGKKSVKEITNIVNQRSQTSGPPFQFMLPSHYTTLPVSLRKNLLI
jgi:hypothetical protein